MKHLLLLGVLLLSLASAFVKCPIDDSGAYFTGRTETISGHLMYEYKCPQGHLFLVRQN